MKSPCPSCSGFQKRSGFTLMELLVVVGIVIILASLLIPGVRTALERANAAKCLSHLRQIGSAALIYAADNNGRMVPYATLNSDGATPGIGKYYIESLAPYLPAPKDASYQYSRIFCCPSQSTRSRVATNPANRYTDYGLAGMNGIFFGVCNPVTGKSRFSLYWCDRSPNLARIPDRSKVMMFSDIARNYFWSTDNLADPTMQNWRHGNGINCVFGDGHAERRLKESIPADPRDVFWNWGNLDPVPL